ncbi:unnamed protein product [Ectocarpus sp. CCAP 1310/34]|nr:unnamed protein product [Ectocarpus sp. CCAP 1310/34]
MCLFSPPVLDNSTGLPLRPGLPTGW